MNLPKSRLRTREALALAHSAGGRSYLCGWGYYVDLAMLQGGPFARASWYWRPGRQPAEATDCVGQLVCVGKLHLGRPRLSLFPVYTRQPSTEAERTTAFLAQEVAQRM